MMQFCINCLVNILLENKFYFKRDSSAFKLEEYVSQTEIGTVCAVINYLKWSRFAALCVCIVKQIRVLKCSVTEEGRQDEKMSDT
jgi:hypothetical protein